MSDTYQRYEAECARIRAANQELLTEFQDWLAERGASEKSIRRHLRNMDLYLNHFLLHEMPTEASCGVLSVRMFLGYWYPRKVLGISETSLRGNAASIRKFYQFMSAKGLVSEEAVLNLGRRIRGSMPEWLEGMNRWR